MKRSIEIFIILLILAGAFGLRYVNPYYVADLPIVPDSAQYVIGGYNLAHGKGPWIYINDLRLPLMYPIGFPLMLAAFYKITGAALHEALYMVLAFGLLSILLFYLFARSVFGKAAALFSALLLATAPLYVGYSQVLISDMVANSFIAAGLWAAWSAATHERLRGWLFLTAGVCCGYATSVHLLSGVTFIPLAVACILRGDTKERCIAFCIASIGFAVGILPILIYNRYAFGSIMQSGYDYWARWGENKKNFSLLYAIRNTAVSEAGDERGNISFYLTHFIGWSWPTLFAPYFPSVLLLAVCGAVAAMKNRAQRFFAYMSLSLIVALLLLLFFYSFQMSKFFLPIVPCVALLGGYGITVLLHVCRGNTLKHRLLRIPVGIVLLLTAWGCIKPYGMHHFRTHAPTWWYEGIARLDAIAPQDAVLVSGIDGVYVTHYFVKNSDRRYMPISREVEYIRHRDLPLPVAAGNSAYLLSLIAQGKKVYMDGFTYNWWGRYRTLLERDFLLQPVARYYGDKLYIYELKAKNGEPYAADRRR
jgi:4-amino-4-deoxy-L-arabinose transferase-like glycosyltransferase